MIGWAQGGVGFDGVGTGEWWSLVRWAQGVVEFGGWAQGGVGFGGWAQGGAGFGGVGPSHDRGSMERTGHMIK